MKRRNFIQSSALISASLMIPSFLKGMKFNDLQKSRSGKILIVVQLSGGNDGLNTIVPYQNDIYYNNRPRLGISSGEVIKLNDELGLNPGMTSLKSLYDEGLVSIVNNVGYPNPNRSHFRSMDIWHSGSGGTEHWNTGWIGRYLDSACQNGEPNYYALEVDKELSLALKGYEKDGFAMSDPIQLKRSTDNRFLKTLSDHQHHQEENLAYLYKTMIDTQSSAQYLSDKSRVYQVKEQFPSSPFGKRLRLIAKLIMADTDTRIFYVSLSGFDTHATQKNRHKMLLKQYSDGMNALVKELKRNGLFKDTLILTFSEFGRRVKQNASNGTDHGTANNLFLIGDQLKQAGIFNEGPDLKNLDKGDLIYKVDFRNIYASILENWLEADAPTVLGKNFNPLKLL